MEDVKFIIYLLIKKFQNIPPFKKNPLIYDIETLKTKIEETERKIRERKEKAKEVIIKSDEYKKKERSFKKWGIFSSLSDWNTDDKNDSFEVKSIKLSDNLGKFNNLIQAGTKSCRKKFSFKRFIKKIISFRFTWR